MKELEKAKQFILDNAPGILLNSLNIDSKLIMGKTGRENILYCYFPVVRDYKSKPVYEYVHQRIAAIHSMNGELTEKQLNELLESVVGHIGKLHEEVADAKHELWQMKNMSFIERLNFLFTK